jgi:hypothetical protein
MITGFNTDVRHGEVVFHVQTEDKGKGNPCVESLVYVGGQILARKRAGYRSLLERDRPEEAITELMERQHKAMIHEIKGGELDEQVAAIQARKPKLQKAPPIGKRSADPQPTKRASTRVEPPPLPPPLPPSSKKVARSDASTSPGVEMPRLPTKEEVLEVLEPARAPEAAEDARPVKRADPSQAAEVPTWVPPRKRGVPKPPPGKGTSKQGDEPDDRSLDQVILDYLEMESDQERLVLSMSPTSGDVAVGTEVTLEFSTVSSVDNDPIGEAVVTVRLISTVEEPLVLAEGRTGDSGKVELTVAIPELPAGTGALIVSAESSIGNAEMRHLI